MVSTDFDSVGMEWRTGAPRFFPVSLSKTSSAFSFPSMKLSTRAPLRMTLTLSATSITSSMWWVIKTTATPR